MRNLREQIQALYRENRNISSKEILERLGIEKPIWRILNDIQVGYRGVSPDRGKNRGRPNSRMKGFRKGQVYFLPPEKKE
jgi:hypothetical protein